MGASISYLLYVLFDISPTYLALSTRKHVYRKNYDMRYLVFPDRWSAIILEIIK